MFDGFRLDLIDTGEAVIRVRYGGSGPPLLLLHGHPQTHAMWYKIAPRLAQNFSVVATDLRGYGQNSKPPTTPDHEPYSKRAMARDQIEVMRHLIYWFWEDLSHFITGMNRGQLWLAYSYIEQTRRKCVNLAHLRHDFTAEPSGYAKVEQEVPEEELLRLQTTFCPIEREAMLEAAETIVGIYQQIAQPLAQQHQIEYPAELEHVLLNRLEQLHKQDSRKRAC